MNENAVIIRRGTEADVPRALDLVKELAEYERAADQVVVSAEEMVEAGFGPKAIYGMFVAELNGQVEGIAIYYTKYSTWQGKCMFLEDFIVTETLRGMGIGRKLFDAVVEVAKQDKSRRMEWQVLDWNEPAINFYKKIGANLDPEWLNGKLNFEQIQSYSFER
jgi:GNAT superfamily N-acetyltransferase